MLPDTFFGAGVTATEDFSFVEELFQNNAVSIIKRLPRISMRSKNKNPHGENKINRELISSSIFFIVANMERPPGLPGVLGSKLRSREHAPA